MTSKEKEKLKLQKIWYKKLKDEGFEDLEYFDDQGKPQEWLKGNSKFSSQEDETVQASDSSALEFECTLEYYLQAAHLLHTATFDNDIDRHIWFLHSEGESLRKIGNQVGYSHPKVLRIINKYRKRNNLG